jgi:hypothetical protein
MARVAVVENGGCHRYEGLPECVRFLQVKPRFGDYRLEWQERLDLEGCDVALRRLRGRDFVLGFPAVY